MRLIKLFLTFFKIGVFTFGGGYAMIPLIQIEVVEKNEWLTNDEFLDAIAVSQSAPGALAVNMAVYIGHKLGGLAGVLACVLGVMLPSFLIILVISIFFYQYRDNSTIRKVFKGVGPAVVALIASSAYKLSESTKVKGKLLIISALALVGVLVGISPIIIILSGGIGMIVVKKWWMS